MLTIIDKPVIQYLAEEAAASGIEEIILVTGRGKSAIENHFDYSFELEHHLEKKNQEDLLAEVRRLGNIAKFIYVRQPHPLGDGHAILCAKEVIGDEPFAVMFGDDIVQSEKPALAQLIEQFEKLNAPILALEKVEGDKISNYGVVEVADSNQKLNQVLGLVEKPQLKDAPSNLGIIGKYIITSEVMKALEKAESGHSDGEIRLIDGFREMLDQHKLYGLVIDGVRYDTGDKFGLIKATIDFALGRDDLREDLVRHLKGLDL
jgi:UTP--glucose-1-phosphate uridylyltransferase